MKQMEETDDRGWWYDWIDERAEQQGSYNT